MLVLYVRAVMLVFVVGASSLSAAEVDTPMSSTSLFHRVRRW